jgi:hypothetical protein
MSGRENLLADAARAAVASILYLVMILLAVASSFHLCRHRGRHSEWQRPGRRSLRRGADCSEIPTDLTVRLALGTLVGLPIFLAIAYVLSRFDLRISEATKPAWTIAL